MAKKLFYIVAFVLIIITIKVALAWDNETYSPQWLSNESYAGRFSGDNDTEGYLYGVDEAQPLTLYGIIANFLGFYDIRVDVLDDYYSGSEKVKAEITIINNGDFPDHDTILIYYLLDPEGNKVKESREQLLEVPPINFLKKECNQYRGIIDKATNNCITKLQRSIYLPENTKMGEWKFKVEYITAVQPQIDVYDAFEVVKSSGWLNFVKKNIIFISIILLLIAILLYQYFNEKHGTTSQLP